MNKGRKANRAMPRRRPVLLLTLGVLLLLTAVLIWIAIPDQTAQAPGAGPYTSVGDIPRVDLAEAKEAYDGKSAVFLDVRTAPEYENGRIPGAVSIPLAELEGRMGELNREDQIITYCTWPAEETSARAALILLNSGFQDVRPIRGGYQAWVESSYPVEW